MSDLITALIFGFTLAISVGPIAMIVILNGVRHGTASAVHSALGAASGDFVFALVSFTIGGAVIAYLNEYRAVTQTISSITLIVFGIYICVSALLLRGNVSIPKNSKQGFFTTFLLTVLNPLTIIAFLALIGQLENTSGLFQSLLLATFIFVGSVFAQLIYAFASVKFRYVLNRPYTILSIQLISGFGILGFGIKGIAT